MSQEDNRSLEIKKKRRLLTRREFLGSSVVLGGGALLAACTPGTPVPDPTAPPATPAETVATATPQPTPVPTPVPEIPMGELVPELEYMNLPFESYQEFVRQFVPQAEQLGLKINVQVVEATTWIERASSQHDYGDFTITAFSLTGERMDPNWVLSELLHSQGAVPGGRNMAEYKNPAMDAIIEAQSTTLDDDERLELIYQAQEIFARDNPWISVYFLNELAAYNKERFEGFVLMPGAGVTRWNNMVSWTNISPKTGDTLFRVDNDHDGNSTNPFVATGGMFNRETIRWVYDRLVIMDEELRIAPWAAESWEWVDPQTLELSLRSGMTFHDGEPVTAEDLVFTINYAQEHQFAEWSGPLRQIDSVELVDAMTMRFNLNQVYAPFISTALPFMFIVPKHVWENVDEPEVYENPQPIGSGPFVFDHWRKNESWRFNRNESHFRAPNVDVLVQIIPERETLLGMLETGEIDALAGGHMRGDDQIRRLQAIEEIETVPWTAGSTTTFFIHSGSEHGSDPAFRAAIHHVVPKTQLVRVLGGEVLGGTVGGSTWIDPESPWHNPDLPQYAEDVDKARQVLAEAGYSWDEEGRLHYPA